MSVWSGRDSINRIRRLMVRAIHHLKASTQESPTEYVDISNGSTVKFLNYDKYYQIVADNYIIRSIKEPMFTKELELTNPEKWDEYLISENELLKRTNLSQLSAHVVQQKEIVKHIKSERIGLNLTKDLTLVNFIGILTVMISIIVGIFLLYSYWKKRFRTKKVEKDIELEEQNKDELLESGKDEESGVDETNFSGEYSEGLRQRAPSTTKVYSVDDVKNRVL